MLLPFLSEILEKIVAEQLTKHLIIINNRYNKFQSAYRCSFSSETVLIKIANNIFHARKNKTCIAFVIIDMSSAFDAIDHNILLHKLSCLFGVRNSVLFWFHSYLCNRTQPLCNHKQL